jgi:hypothetical protein
VNELRASVAAAGESFVERLHALGFRSVSANEFVGDVTVGDVAVEHIIELPDDFPFVKPRVRTTDGFGGLSWHRERDGRFCMWGKDEAAHLPWADADAVVARIADWHRRDALGWPGDPPDLDLNRYWPQTPALILHGDLSPLVGRSCKVTRTRNGAYQLQDGPASRKHRHPRSVSASVVDLGELTAPVHTLDELLELLDADEARQLRSLIDGGSCKVIVARYTRQEHAGSLGLVVTGSDPLELKAATTAQTDIASLRLRAGHDAGVLENRRVAIVGVGAIGSVTADLLARSGVGSLTLCDGDLLLPGNCIRHLAGIEDVGRAKVAAVSDRLVNDGMQQSAVRAVPEFVTSLETAEELFRDHDIVIDATGHAPATALITTASRLLARPAITVCLQRGGTVARVDRTPPVGDTNHAPPTPPGSPWPEVRDGSCGDPVSPAPPWACAAAAALAAGVAVDVLTGREQYPATVSQVLVADHDVPTVGWRHGD